MSTTSEKQKLSINTQNDFLPLLGTDYVEFFVGNAKQAAHYYLTAFGFNALAYAGPETGVKEKASYVVRQNKLTFVLTTPLRPGNEIADHIYKHGDGVKVLALLVNDATDAYQQTTRRGAKIYLEPQRLKDEDGEVVVSGIHTYGDTVHLFVERKNYRGMFMPGYRKWENKFFTTSSTGLQYVDHCVGNVGWNGMNKWVKQGVLLLNASLTVRGGEPMSHSRLGWEKFTNTVIEKVSDLKEHVVFVLWGKFAQEKQALIDEKKHYIIKSAHPSPLSAKNGFFGSRPFSKINNYLVKKGIDPIDWAL